jgi:serine/threonine-protein kinase HipA
VVTELKVWMNGEAVGLWTVDSSGGHRFDYDPAWRASSHVRPVSRSIPLDDTGRVQGPAVGRWFEGLLPEDPQHRRFLQTRFGARSLEPVDLLAAAGQDCVGAVQLRLPDDDAAAPRGIRSTPLGAREVEDDLRQLTRGADSTDPGLRLVLPGGRDKAALMRIGAAWHRPIGSTPTTHLLKLASGRPQGEARFDLGSAVENEWLCLRFLRALGLPAARAEIARFGAIKALVVERFDRAWVMGDSPWIARLPQEDLGQALGVVPSAKYESQGGPGVRDVLALLAGSAEAARDARVFLCAQFAFWLLAALDGHARNFSIFLHRGAQFRLAPLYDVVSAWPAIGDGPQQIAWENARLAMAIGGGNGHTQLGQIGPDHWRELAAASDVPHAWEALVAVSGRVDDALAAVAAQRGVEIPDGLAESMFAGVRRQNAAFRQGL